MDSMARVRYLCRHCRGRHGGACQHMVRSRRSHRADHVALQNSALGADRRFRGDFGRPARADLRT